MCHVNPCVAHIDLPSGLVMLLMHINICLRFFGTILWRGTNSGDDMHGGGLWSQLMTPDWPSALHWPVDTVWDGGYCRKTVGIMQQWNENNYSIFFLSQDIYRFIAVKMHVLQYFQVQTQQRHQTKPNNVFGFSDFKTNHWMCLSRWSIVSCEENLLWISLSSDVSPLI